jgi:hypothetical protein
MKPTDGERSTSDPNPTTGTTRIRYYVHAN